MSSDSEIGLADRIVQALVDGAFGVTLHSGRLPVVHLKGGLGRLREDLLTESEVISIIRHFTDSREKRDLHQRTVVSFMHTLPPGIRVLGQARETTPARLELRRMRDQQIDAPNSSPAAGSE